MMENQAIQQTEVVVVGGGMVGSALALGLAQQGFSVAVVESMIAPPFDEQSPPDVRVSAISAGSVALLERLAVWQDVLAMRAHAYRRLETWEWDNALLQFDARALNVPQLGYMVENAVLQRALWRQLAQHPSVRLYAPATLSQLQREGDRWQVTLADGRQLQGRLVVGADGAQSRVRSLAGIGVYGWQYRQSCLLITVQCQRPAGDCTWQHFTPQGPMALLPLFDRWATLAWYQHPARIARLQAMSAGALREQILAHFPARLGEVTAHAWDSFALTRRHALGYVAAGIALVGDAAHSIHPLAGQGVNLGYRDVRALLEVLVKARKQGENWGDEAVLRRYQRARIGDNHVMQAAMDVFYVGFGSSLAPLPLLRNLGLMAAQRAGFLKRQALRYALGI